MKTAEQRLSTGLGWFSTGLGIVSLASPGRVSRLIGLRDTKGTRRAIRAVGVQELTAAGGIFSSGRPAPAMWTRVAGDVLHVGLMTRALGDGAARKGRTAATIGALAGVTALDAVVARRLAETAPGTLHVKVAITVNRPPHEVYDRWRDLESLPAFLWHLESVAVLDERRSHWVAKAPLGRTVEWDAELVDDVPGERLSWRSVEGATVPNRGSVAFAEAPGGGRTELVVELEYEPPLGSAGATVAKLFGEEPQQQLRDDLRRFKQLVEIGEVLRSDGSPEGTTTQNQWPGAQDAAQPKEDVA